MTIDDNLDWGSHMEKIIKKESSGIGAIKRVRHLVPQATLQLNYQALIHPHFNYCNTVWGNCGITLRNKLKKLQNRAALLLTFSDYNEDACYLFELPGWKILAHQHETEKGTMVYKSLHGLAPEYLCSRFAIREKVYNRQAESFTKFKCLLKQVLQGTTFIYLSLDCRLRIFYLFSLCYFQTVNSKKF